MGKGFVFTKLIPKTPVPRATLSVPAVVQRCRLLPAGVGVLGGQLYAAGGHDGPLVRKSVEVYDAQTNTWRLVCDMNMCRRNAGQTDAMTPGGVSSGPLRPLHSPLCFSSRRVRH